MRRAAGTIIKPSARQQIARNLVGNEGFPQIALIKVSPPPPTRANANNRADGVHAQLAGRYEEMVRNNPCRGFDLRGQGRLIMGRQNPGFRCNRS